MQRIELLLGMHNYRCTLAAISQQGIGRYEAGEFILIITDLRLLDMTRLDILQAIKRSHPHCQIIQRSNYSSIDNAA